MRKSRAWLRSVRPCALRLHVGKAIASCCLGLAMIGGYGHSSDARQEPVRVEREYYCHSLVTTWDALVAQSDVVAEVVVNSSVGGELEYYGSFKSVVTAHEVKIRRLLFRSRTARVDESKPILVLTPGGRVDRGEYIEHVITNDADPWPPGATYIVALEWDTRLQAWRPIGDSESAFRVMPDGTLTSPGNGPLAREAVRLGLAAVTNKVQEAAARWWAAVSG